MTGAFMVFGALWSKRHETRALVTGGLLAICGPLLALALGAGPTFLLFACSAALPALAAVLLARRYGSLSLPAILCATLAIALSAPVAATAGGVPAAHALLALALLAPFFAWRTEHVRRVLTRHAPDRPSARTAGLREARRAAVWCALVVVLLRSI